nr:hypothetical protein [Angustibacter aerolatus]
MPLFLSGLAVSIGFRMNLFNIGVEGQYTVAAVVAAWAGAAVGLPLPLHIAFIVVVAMAAGAAYAAVPAVLKVTRGVNEVITTIMLNSIAVGLVAYLLRVPFRDPKIGPNSNPATREPARVGAVPRDQGPVRLARSRHPEPPAQRVPVRGAGGRRGRGARGEPHPVRLRAAGLRSQRLRGRGERHPGAPHDHPGDAALRGAGRAGRAAAGAGRGLQVRRVVHQRAGFQRHRGRAARPQLAVRHRHRRTPVRVPRPRRAVAAAAGHPAVRRRHHPGRDRALRRRRERGRPQAAAARRGPPGGPRGQAGRRAAGGVGVSTATSTPAAQTARTSHWRRYLLIALAGLVVLAITRQVSGEQVLTNSGTARAMLALMLPIAMAGLGGLVCERAGVVNIGLEGMMILGTWGAGFAGYQWGPWAALVGALAGGVLGGLLHAVATVTFGVDHIVSGVAINLLASGAARFLSDRLRRRQGRRAHPVARREGRRAVVRRAGAGQRPRPARQAGEHPRRPAVGRRRAPARPAPRRQRLRDHRRAALPAGRVRAVAHRVRPAAALGRREPVGRRVAGRAGAADEVRRGDQQRCARRHGRVVPGALRRAVPRGPDRRPRLHRSRRDDLRQLAAGRTLRRRGPVRVRRRDPAALAGLARRAGAVPAGRRRGARARCLLGVARTPGGRRRLPRGRRRAAAGLLRPRRAAQ